MNTKRKKITFSQKEKEILQLISNGYTSNEIATELNISFASVQSAVREMLNKTLILNRAQLVRYGFEQGYLK